MTAIKAQDVDALIRKGPAPNIQVILIYGPDTGLVADRASALATRFVGDSEDPFALVRLDGDTIASDPGRLMDEAGTIGLFGGSRTIRIRAGSKSIAPAIETLLQSDPAGTRVVIEAGDLKNAPLRTLCEKSPKALALPCYPDDERALAALVTTTLARDGIEIDDDGRDLLVASLGGDRRASLMEIEKLALYARGEGRIGVEEVEAVASDVSASVLNALIDAAFEGQREVVERELRRFRQEGLDASALLGAALRHAFTLLGLQLDQPGAAPAALAAAWRGLHFKRRSGVTRQFGRWSPEATRRVVANLQEAVLSARRSGGDLAQVHASRVILRITAEAAPRRS